MASQFSTDGKYFAQITDDGKLKVWDTHSATFQQEYVPDFHLTSPCTCLHFVQRLDSYASGSPRKKIKKRHSQDAQNSTCIVLGTSAGTLLVYSLAKGKLEYKIKSDAGQRIGCLTWCEGNTVFTGGENLIMCFDLENRELKSKWKVPNEKITAVLAIPDSNNLLSASKSIKLWDIYTVEVLKTFTGHSYDITLLYFIQTKENSNGYFISASKGDRLLSCWSLDPKLDDQNSVATFTTEDVCNGVSVVVTQDGSTNLSAVTRSGVVHVFRHKPNGKCSKPVKPKVTVQVASDTGESDALVAPIPILGAVFRQDGNLNIAYGNQLLLQFEDVALSEYEKVQCLIRKDPRKVTATTKLEDVSRVRAPLVDGGVNYLTPFTSAVDAKEVKRKNAGKIEVPMEKRLENLQLNRVVENGARVGLPRVDNVAQLLVQGLHSRDKNIMRSVLSQKDEGVVRNTVKRLPMPVIVPLVHELNGLIQGKTGMSHIGALWLKNVIQIHAGLLLSNPELPDLLGATVGSIQNRLALHMPLSNLRGRLDLLVSQISSNTNSNNQSQEDDALLVYNDTALSEDGSSDLMEMVPHSDSDNEWMEESSNDEDALEDDAEDDESDEDMST